MNASGSSFDDLIDLPLLERYLAGQHSPGEGMRVDAWLAQDPAHREELERLRRMISLTHGTRPVTGDVEAMLGQLHDRMAVAPRRLPPTMHLERPALRVWPAAGIAVAVTVAIAGLAHTVRHVAGRTGSIAREYITADAQRTTFTLMDGTRVTLGPASRIRVPAAYATGGRDLILEGEAYFAVVHDPAHPLAVHVGDIVTQDIGTAFDVRHYATDRQVRVAVAEGQVAIGTTLMHAGDVALADAHTVGLTHPADIAALTAWMQNGLVFDETPLRDVIRDVSRTFGVTITLADTALASVPVTATFSGQPLAVVMDAITRVAKAQYERDAHGIVVKKRVARVQGSQPRPPALTTARVEGIA